MIKIRVGVGVITGCGLGGLSWLEENYSVINQQGTQTGESVFHSADDRKHGAGNDFDSL